MSEEKLGKLGAAQDHVVEQLLGKSWGELETLEHAGYLLFPETLYRRTKDGSFEEIKVALRVPREYERRAARVEARRMATAEGLDPKLDADMIDELETLCLLWRAIRMPTHPHDPLVMSVEELDKTYDRACLIQAYGKLDALHQVIDPSPASISEAEMFALLAAVAKERNLLPLAVYAPDARDSFTITTAVLLQSLLESKSSSEQSGPSTPE